MNRFPRWTTRPALYLEGVLKDAVETYHKTVILVTHDIDEAGSHCRNASSCSAGVPPALEDRARHRYPRAPSPIAARSDGRFSGYFHSLCAELDIQTEKTA